MSDFDSLKISKPVLDALQQLGYETPTEIQKLSIPFALDGRDFIAQAPTGCGKTAAFALPILTNIDTKLQAPQALILTPTRELAIQVAEAFQSYAKCIPGFHVLPIYGGQDFRPQFRALERGVHVIVGTPGRIMDHLRRGSLPMQALKTVVLDEADEMLKMGFIDDVEWILEQISQEHQTVLFSATMPDSIRKVASKYLKNPEKIKIGATHTQKPDIAQGFVLTHREKKLEVLTRFLEIEEFEAAIIFTRTKNASSELAEKLEARGYRAAAINGDMAQAMREKTIARMKQGNLDIIVATEVAARGLDVERISYVINYDVPSDVESYVHRIGRTGRAGRAGKSLVFITPRERYLLRQIENATLQKVTEFTIPSQNQIQEKRLQKLVSEIQKTLMSEDISKYKTSIAQIARETDLEMQDIAAALLSFNQSKKMTAVEDLTDMAPSSSYSRDSRDSRDFRDSRDSRSSRDSFSKKDRDSNPRKGRATRQPEEGMVRCKMELGRQNNITPSDIVGLIANKADINRKNIGQIHIFDDHTLVDIAEPVLQKVISKIHDCKLKQKQTKIKPV